MINRFFLLLLSFLVFLYCTLISNYLIITSVGLSFALFIFFSFVNKFGHELPIKEFILLLASFQWIVGAKISYNLGKQHYKYYMYVPEDEYMSYVVPAVLLLYLGISFFPIRLNLDELREVVISKAKTLKNGATALVFIGVISAVISRFYQGGLSFVLFLAELLLYVGLSYFFLIYRKYKYIILFVTLAIVLFLAINKGSFHKLLLVGSFLSFFAFPSRIKFFQKLMVIMIGVTFVFVIQTVKKDFRDIIWRSNSKESRISVFWNLIQEELSGKPNNTYISNRDKAVEEQAELNVRLNQGWIISKTLENVPKNVSFLHGRTIMESIEASILPRFLFPDKKGAGQGLDNFREITGLALNNTTSMELSIVAEFYANYGHLGGQLSMFIYGLLLAILIRFIVFQLGNGSMLIYLWFILFFMQPVKAEIDLIKILNHLIKSIMFFIFIKYLLIQLLGYKLFVNTEQ